MKRLFAILCLTGAPCWFGCSSGAAHRDTSQPRARGADGDATPTQDPSSLRVEFEELALDGAPAFVTDFAFYPGSDSDLLALSKDGKLMRYRLDEQRTTLLVSSKVEGVYDHLDCGAISLAFEPDFTQGRYLYVGSCVSETHSEILRLDLDENLNVIEGSEVSVFRAGSAAATRPLHNVGSIGFEPSGVMWALFGDKAQRTPAQDLSDDLGKLVRFVPSREPGLGGHRPAPDGPLVGNADQAQAAYALGLRSPFRATLDSRGRYWIADVGSDFFEEINVVGEPLSNFGWPDHEGPCNHCDGTTSPAFSWPHGDAADYLGDDPDVEATDGRVAIVGPEVLPHDPDRYGKRLAGSVLFGDYCAGFLRQARLDDHGTPTQDSPLGHLKNASAFRQHSDGYVYAMTFGRCETGEDNPGDETYSRLFRMVPKE